MTKELMGFSSYRVKILLDLVNILQIAFDKNRKGMFDAFPTSEGKADY